MKTTAPSLSAVLLLAFIAGFLCPRSNLTGSEADLPKSYPVLSGVGLALRLEGGKFFVGRVMEGGPAAESNAIHPEDRLVAIESGGTKVVLQGTEMGEATSRIRGPVGTEVTLTLIPSGSTQEIAVKLKRKPLPIRGQSEATYAEFVGKPLPELPFTDLDGKPTHPLADSRGKFVVLDFWASWCSTCYEPVTKLHSLSTHRQDWKGKIEWIAVTIDSDRGEAVKAINGQDWGGLLHRSVEPEKLEALGWVSVPILIILDPEGRVITMAESHALDLEAELNAILTP